MRPLVRGLSTLLAVAACQPAPATVDTAVARQWVKVRVTEDARPLEGPARVVASPAATRVVTVPFRATVVGVRVREGDLVDAGAPLLDVLMPELLEAAGRLEGARIRLRAWEERGQHLAVLRQDGLARAMEVSEATVREAEALAEVHGARAVLRSAGLRDAEVAPLLSGAGQLTLKAPVDGVVTQVSATPGESREPSAGPLVSISGSGPVRVEARFPRPPPAGAWHFVDAAGRRSALRLVSRSPTADARDGSFVAWLEPAEPLVAGTLGRVVSSGGADALATFLVPAAALRREGAQALLETRRGRVQVVVHRCGEDTCTASGDVRLDDEALVERSP